MARKKSIWHYVRSYKFNSIFFKYFLLIFMCVILPLSGISIIIYNYTSTIFKQEVGAAYEKSLATVMNMFDMISGEVERVATRIVYDRNVDEFMSSEMQNFSQYRNVDMLNQIMNSTNIFENDYINSIYIYSESSNNILCSKKGVSDLETFNDNKWIDQYNEMKKNNNIWVSSRKYTDSMSGEIHNFISFFYTSPLMDREKKGVIIINIDLKSLQTFLKKAGTSQTDRIYIMNQQGNILFSDDADQIGVDAKNIKLLKDIISNGKKSYIEKDAGSSGAFITQIVSEYNQWKYMSVIPLQQYEIKIYYLKRIIVFVILASAFFVSIVAFGIAVNIYMPIRDIVEMIKKPDEIIPQKEKTINNDSNEYQFIMLNFIQALNQNKSMEQELSERMYKLQQAQIGALQSQINPHFLYNTLQAINWLVIGLTKGENNASYAIESLSKILRATIETDSYLITISDEIQYAHKYIEIQKLRYKNKFDVEWDIEEELEGYMTVKLVLQPIIENAIYHGIKPKNEKGLIRIKGYSWGNSIVMEIDDDGVGMDTEEIERLNAGLCSDYMQGGKHIGLKNVNQRLKLIFGKEYGVQLSTGSTAGLNVKIVIPKVKKSYSVS